MKKHLLPKRFVWVTIILSMFLFCQCDPRSSPIVTKETEIELKFARAPKPESVPKFKLLPKEEIIAKYWEYYNKLEINRGYENEIKMAISDFPEDRKRLFVEAEITDRSPRYDEDRNAVIYYVDGPVQMEIDGQDGQLIALGNKSLFYILYTLPTNELQKTEAEIIQVAEKYRQLIMGDFPQGIVYAPPVAKLVEPHRGGWLVQWERMINGYSVPWSVSITIYERYNNTLMFWHNDKSRRQKNLCCPTNVKISEDEAKKIAWAALAWLQKNYNYLKDAKFTHIKETKLSIISPNYLFDPEVADRYSGYLFHNNIRLAYQIYFSGYWEPNRDERWLSIGVDATTGEVLDAELPK